MYDIAAVIYARLSREDEEKIDKSSNSKSIKHQIKYLKEYAKEHDYHVTKIYIDDGYSGGDFNRPKFQEMLKDMRRRKIDILLVKDLSRLGRVMYKVGQYIEEIFPELGVRTIAVDDKYDSANTNDENFVFHIFVNEYFLKDFKRKCRKARIFKAQTTHLNYYPKFGYIHDEKRREFIDEWSSSVVIRIFHLIADENMSTFQVANLLNEEGVMTRAIYQTQVLGLKALNKNPSNKWTAAKVWEIATDIEYCGHSLNWTRHKKEERILLKNTHLPIIDEELFERAQKSIASRSTVKEKLNHLGQILIDKKTGHNLLYNINRQCKTNKASYFLRVNNRCQYKIYASAIEDVLYKDTLKLVEQCLEDKERVLEILKEQYLGKNKVDFVEVEKELKRLNKEFEGHFIRNFRKEITYDEYLRLIGPLNKKIRKLEDVLLTKDEVENDLHNLENRFYAFCYKIPSLPIDKIDFIKNIVKTVDIIKVKSPTSFDIKIKYKFM